MTDARRHAPATARNRDPILAVLRRHLPERGMLLEVSSGTGEHAVHLAAAFPGLLWQPTDPDPAARASIAAWAAEARLPNLLPPLDLDAAAETWPVTQADAVLCINMIHIAPWEAGLGLIRGAARLLPPGGPLILYGPYRRGRQHTAPSNAAFDESLRAQDPRWGVRNLEDVAEAAAQAGFGPPAIEEMPANNLTVIFRRAG
jgi:SAM-dependent methyltransferase